MNSHIQTSFTFLCSDGKIDFVIINFYQQTNNKLFDDRKVIMYFVLYEWIKFETEKRSWMKNEKFILVDYRGGI